MDEKGAQGQYLKIGKKNLQVSNDTDRSTITCLRVFADM
jgi:topoisomerase IA-like protein